MPHQQPETIQRPDWLTDEVWPFRTRTYVHDGRPVHYIDEGEGPTLVFVHAGMWSFVWRDLIELLRTDFRCLALDYPGSGLTPGSRDDVDLDRFSSLTRAWLEHLHVDDAVFVVHDLGGVVGVNVAADRADTVQGIVAINSFAWPPHVRALRVMLRVMGGATATWVLGSLRVIPRMTRTRFGVGRQLGRADKRAFFGPYRERRGAARNFHRAMASVRRSGPLFERADTELKTRLSGAPALLVFGENNDPFGFADLWHRRLPAATSKVIDGGNHFPMCDDPDLVASWIREWHEQAVVPAGLGLTADG